MSLEKTFINNLIQFRQELHKYPELSGNERETQKRIVKFLSELKSFKLTKNIGGLGLLYLYDSGNEGDTILFRGDIDALPIEESNEFNYKSRNQGVAHLCGHDGHTVILCGLAKLVHDNPPKKGRVAILFQPAEETGMGADLVINDEKFSEIKPDYCFALHNLPGFPIGQICMKNEWFASASTGIIVNLKGLSSHAAHPEDGNNPDKCIASLIKEFNSYNDNYLDKGFKDFILSTIIHIKLGDIAFGTTPGKAVLMATLRSVRNDDMDKLKNDFIEIIKNEAGKYKINHNISFEEEFPACYNHNDAFKILENAINNLNYERLLLNKPFRWSEDFGHFSKISKACIFGIGAGENHPQLHNEDYDFPDEIIQKGLLIFYQIYKNLLC